MTASVTRLPTSSDQAAELSDQELLRLVQSLPYDSEDHDAACEELINRYQSLVRSCAMRYRQSPESQEELMQVGYVGLLKAINNFDPALGGNLAAYAQPCVSGEIKRHFRDKRWQVHVKRSTQELRQELRRARVDLTQSLARSPRSDELATHLGVSDEDLRDAERADLWATAVLVADAVTATARPCPHSSHRGNRRPKEPGPAGSRRPGSTTPDTTADLDREMLTSGG